MANRPAFGVLVVGDEANLRELVRNYLVREGTVKAEKAGRDTSRELIFDGLRIDPAGREVRVGGERVELTALEFDLFLALASYPGVVLTREQLIEKVWRYDFYGDERVVDVHIKELRRKLRDSQPPRLWRTWCRWCR